MSYTITCPYCFGHFKDNQVVFRLSHGYDRADDEKSISRSAREKEERRPYYFYEECDDLGDISTQDARKVDRELVNFWANRGASAGYSKDDVNWNLPHADPSDPETFRRIVSMEPRAGFVPGSDGLVRDPDGFVCRIVERDGDPGTGEMTRLCPHCHNPLPLSDYGKYHTLFIGITGMTGAGKTVFLTQLLSNLSNGLMDGSGYRVSNVDMRLATITANSTLPDATDTVVMRRPWAINLLADDSGLDENQTLVFYDIAGENCVIYPEDTERTIEAKKCLSSYLAQMNALFFLVDPEQIPALSGCAGDARASVADLVQRIVNIRSNNIETRNWDDTPVAVVITKVDGDIKGHLERDVLHDVFGPVARLDRNQNPYRGFPREEFVPLNTRLHAVFSNSIPMVEGQLKSFKRRGYFAVSALPAGTRQIVHMHQNEYALSGSDFTKVKHMKRWMQGWDERTPENRVYYASSNDSQTCGTYPGLVHCKDGSSIRFPYSYDSKACSTVVTDVVVRPFAARGTDANMPAQNLTVGDIRDLKFATVAAGTAIPLRIEEPLKWILWRCGIIREPVFEYSGEPPKRRFFHTKRQWDEIMENHARLEDEACADFYSCENPCEGSVRTCE